MVCVCGGGGDVGNKYCEQVKWTVCWMVTKSEETKKAARAGEYRGVCVCTVSDREDSPSR